MAGVSRIYCVWMVLHFVGKQEDSKPTATQYRQQKAIRLFCSEQGSFSNQFRRTHGSFLAKDQQDPNSMERMDHRQGPGAQSISGRSTHHFRVCVPARLVLSRRSRIIVVTGQPSFLLQPRPFSRCLKARHAHCGRRLQQLPYHDTVACRPANGTAGGQTTRCGQFEQSGSQIALGCTQHMALQLTVYLCSG